MQMQSEFQVASIGKKSFIAGRIVKDNNMYSQSTGTGVGLYSNELISSYPVEDKQKCN